MLHPTDRIIHTTAFVVEHWLEILSLVPQMSGLEWFHCICLICSKMHQFIFQKLIPVLDGGSVKCDILRHFKRTKLKMPRHLEGFLECVSPNKSIKIKFQRSNSWILQLNVT